MNIPVRAIAPLAIAAAIALVGCGGDDGESTTGSTQPQSTSTAEQGPTGSDQKQTTEDQGGQKEGAGSKQGEEAKAGSTPSGPAPTTTASLPNEGTKRAAPGVPTNKGGDNSIQIYGTEAPAQERVDAAIALQAYLDARAAKDWATACSYLSSSNQKLMEKFAERAPNLEEGASCPQVLAAFTGNVSRSALAAEARIEVISFRVQSDHAFILYRNDRGRVIGQPMSREQSGWKLGSLGGVPLG